MSATTLVYFVLYNTKLVIKLIYSAKHINKKKEFSAYLLYKLLLKKQLQNLNKVNLNSDPFGLICYQHYLSILK